VNTRLKNIILVAALCVFAANRTALGCAACYGASDSPMAQGMNWGIMTLLVFVCCVLSAVTLFFVHVARRSSALENDATNSIQPETKQ
jgi:uncharacterized membrane protein